MDEKGFLSSLGKLFTTGGSVLTTAVNILNSISELKFAKVIGEHVVGQAGPAFGEKFKRNVVLRRKGNVLEFNEALSLLTAEEFEFINELMDLMTNAEQEYFQQQMAKTGKDAEATAARLGKTIGLGNLQAALSDLRKNDYLQPPASDAKRAPEVWDRFRNKIVSRIKGGE